MTPNTIELLDYYDDSKDTRHFSFRLLDPAAMAKPQPGQFFMLYVPGSGAAPFTYTSMPDERGRFRALVRRVGSLTTTLFDCQPGARLGARGPFGKGWPLEQLSNQRVLIVAGGCGLAPLVSLTDYLLEHQCCQQLTLLYGAARETTQMLNRERQRWQHTMGVYDVVEDKHYQGLTGTPLDAMNSVLDEINHMPDVVLLCGPEIMMQGVAADFVNRGLPSNSIWLSIERRMHCAVGLCGHCYVEHQYACKDGPTYRWDQLQALTSVPVVTQQYGS